MAQEWDIRPRAEACHACAAPFADQQVFYSVLCESNEGYPREDYCEKCHPAADDPRFVSCWKGVFHMPPPPPEDPLKKESAESLLRKLIEENNPNHVRVIYILAVMLERKRVFVERDVKRQENQDTLRIYEHRRTGETFVITEPHLQLDQLEQVQTEVLAMLGVGTEPAGGTVPTPEPTPEAPCTT